MSIVVTVDHVREARLRHGGFCARGMDVWGKRYGLDLRVFLREGYPIEVFEGIDDAFARQIVEVAREMERNKV